MKRFRFELDPLLRKHTWEADVLRTEKATANRAVVEQERELQAIQKEIQDCCDTLIQASGQDADISIAQRQVLAVYLRHQHDLASEAKMSLEKARKIEQQIAEQLLAASQQVKTLEKLRDGEQKKYDYLRLRAEFNESDENWLVRHKPA